MDETLLRRLGELYGLGGPAHMALQFPRLPPGLAGAGPHGPEHLRSMARKLGPGLEDHTGIYRRRASALAGNYNDAPKEPGHPVYSRGGTLGSLEAENAKLRKENIDLKAQLGRMQIGAQNP